MKNKKMPKLLLLFSILIIAFQHNYCSAQIQTIASTKGIEFSNLDITLNGRVKSIMIITHKPDYSCDTKKAKPGNDLHARLPSGACWEKVCDADTLIYYFDQDLVISKIIKIDYSIYKVGYYVHKETEFNFENGLLKSEISEGVRTPVSSKNYTYDSNKNLILKTVSFSFAVFNEYYKYDKNNNLVNKNWFRYYPAYDTSTILLNTEVYEYDAFNHLIKKEWGENRADFFKYNSLGNKIEEGYGYSTKRKKYHYIPSQGFVYDSNNRLIKSFRIGKGNLYRTETYYEYDNEGREIEIKTYKISNDTVLDYHLTKEYNEKGELIKEESKIGSGTHFSPKYIECKKKITAYDNYGNITQIRLSECKRYDEKTKSYEYYEKIYRYVYTYDSYGNWIKREEFEGESEDTLERIQIEDRIIEYY